MLLRLLQEYWLFYDLGKGTSDVSIFVIAAKT